MSNIKDLETQPSMVGQEKQNTSRFWMCSFLPWFPRVRKLCLVFETFWQVYSTAVTERAGQATIHWTGTVTKLAKFGPIGIPHIFPCFQSSLILSGNISWMGIPNVKRLGCCTWAALPRFSFSASWQLHENGKCKFHFRIFCDPVKFPMDLLSIHIVYTYLSIFFLFMGHSVGMTGCTLLFTVFCRC